VTQTDNSFTDNSPASSVGTPSLPHSSTARIVWVILILATLYSCYFRNLGAIGLVGPDEPRYAWIARDMAETGDWVTPRLYGKPWFEKPVLYYWGAAASFKLFGVSEAAARLPSAICALLATLAMAWLAWKLYGGETARWLLLLLPTTIGMIGFSHAAATDMPFAGMLTIAMVFAAVIIGLTRNENSPILPRTPWLALFLFGFFLGLAVLAKGPAAIILSGSAVLLWAAFTKRWRDAVRCLHPAAIAAFCLTALPWYVLCARRNPDFFRIFIIEHNFKRFLTPEFQHIQPYWYYLPIVLIAFLPWTLALLSSALFGVLRYARGQRISSFTLFLLCWTLFCLLFFSISKSKLPGYILPAIPAIGLLLTKSYTQMSASESRRFRWIQSIAGVLLCVLGAAMMAMSCVKSVPSPHIAIGESWVLLAFGIASALFGLNRRRMMSSWSVDSFCVIPILLLLCFFSRLDANFLPWDPSGKTLAKEILEQRIPLEQVYVANMRRAQQYSLNFYLHHETQQWNPAAPKNGYILVKFMSCWGKGVQTPLACAGSAAQQTPSGWFIYQFKRQD
jgi:4-amino-4-deoxy-L-arabinose transferase-like glycosyltransferase